MKRFISIILVLLSIFLFSNSNAQGKLGVFVGGGMMTYTGDLQENPWPHAKTLCWTANAGLHWQITRRWGLQLNYTIGKVQGSDQFAKAADRIARDLRFSSLLHEIGIRGTFDILPNDSWKVLPYITAGVAALNFEPKRDGVALRGMQNEGVSYSNWTVSIPTGLGVKWQINCRWALKGEFVYHWTITDYLDDVSGDYLTPTGDPDIDFYRDPGNVALTRDSRGTSKWKDGFWDLNVGVIYFFHGCGSSKKGGLIEDCEELYKDVDLKELQEQYK
ncbi:MAG: porin family protein [Flavobacteriales bacterium]|nr:porin family protein [Flavobacteriales bacterium]